MRIDEKLAAKQTFSFEIFPPKGDLPIDEAIGVARELDKSDPDWISVTFSAGGSGNSANTVSVSGAIEEQTNTTALAHLTCLGSSKEDVDVYLDALSELGVQNVLALRGDRAPGKETIDFEYATDLIAYIKQTRPEFCVGAACYPEGHFECDDFETSLRHLRLKQDVGADFLVTQLFFDNELFYRFRDGCARHRIKIPSPAASCPSPASGKSSAWRSPAARPSPRRSSARSWRWVTTTPPSCGPASSTPASRSWTSRPTASTASTSTP